MYVIELGRQFLSYEIIAGEGLRMSWLNLTTGVSIGQYHI